jgi:hypothetical protein
VVGYLGKSRMVTVKGGKLLLSLGPRPVYVVDRSQAFSSKTRGTGISKKPE